MPSARSKRRFLWILLLVLAAGSGFGFYYYQRKEKPLSVQTEKVLRRNLIETVIANGRIQPVLQVKISPEVSGEIIELPVKEGQFVRKGDLLVRIKPDAYIASRNSKEALYHSSGANRNLAAANLNKAETEFHRQEELFKTALISESVFQEFRTAFEVAKASHQASIHQVEVAQAALAQANEELTRTTIYAPISGTVIKLNSETGERVVGTAMMTGTDIMTVANLDDMEARVDVGEMDVILMNLGQNARLEVDAFRDREFAGTVTEIANASKMAQAMGVQQNPTEATRFEVRIRFHEKDPFRPGMSVTAHIETRYRTNVLSIPIQSVTTRPPKPPSRSSSDSNTVSTATNPIPAQSSSKASPSNSANKDKSSKPIEVVFLITNQTVLAVPILRGVSDENHVEILSGLGEGQEVVTGSFKAISQELKDGSLIQVSTTNAPPRST